MVPLQWQLQNSQPTATSQTKTRSCCMMALKSPSLICVFLIAFLEVARANTAVEQSLAAALFNASKYDPSIRPSGVNSTLPTVVRVDFYVENFPKIDVTNGEYEIQMYFREFWVDDRLKYEDMLDGNLDFLSLSDTSKIWRPDLFFVGQRKEKLHGAILPNTFARIYPEGSVLMSSRLTLRMSNSMDLRAFPMDSQLFSLRIESYGFTAKELITAWKSEGGVQMADNINSPGYIFNAVSTRRCDVVIKQHSYSCLAADFAFRRELRPLVLHFYVPTAALVLASWAPMWLRPRAAKLRVLLGVAALAGVVYASAGVCDTLPPLAYAVAADVWRSGCVLLVAGVLLHYAFLRYVLQTRGTRAAPFIDSAVDSKSEASLTPAWISDDNIQGLRIDRIGRMVFPFIFCSFNLVYWIYYLNY